MPHLHQEDHFSGVELFELFGQVCRIGDDLLAELRILDELLERLFELSHGKTESIAVVDRASRTCRYSTGTFGIRRASRAVRARRAKIVQRTVFRAHRDSGCCMVFGATVYATRTAADRV